MNTTKKMDHSKVLMVLRGKTQEEQAEILKKIGLPENEIPPYLHWANQRETNPPEAKKKSTNPFKESAFFKRIEEKYQQGLLPSAEPEEEKLPFTPLERDILHTQYLLGGPSRYDGASFHNPDLKDTDVFRWFKYEYGLSRYYFALVIGGPGSTKTWGSLAHINRVAKVTWQQGEIAYSNAMYVHSYNLALMLQDPRTNRDQLDLMIRKPILLLDDLGTEPVGYRGSDFLAHFEYLMNERHKFRRETIMTSNTTAQGFKDLYGGRIVSRFNEIGLFKETAAPDMRKEAV